MKTILNTLAVLIGLTICLTSNAQNRKPYSIMDDCDVMRYDHDTVYLFKYLESGYMMNYFKIPVIDLRKGANIGLSDIERALRGYNVPYKIQHLPTSFFEASRIDTVFYLTYHDKVIEGRKFKVEDHVILWTFSNIFFTFVFPLFCSMLVSLLLMIFIFKIMIKIRSDFFKEVVLWYGISALIVGLALIVAEQYVFVPSTTVLWSKIICTVVATCVIVIRLYKVYQRKETA